MPTNTDNIHVLNDMLIAYNAHDPNRVASFYKEDAVIEVEGVQPTIRGRSDDRGDATHPIRT